MFQKLFMDMAVKMAPVIAEIVAKQVVALMPVIVAAASKAIGDQLKSALPVGFGLPDVPDIAETVRQQVNKIPGLDIPVLSDLFDLSEMFGMKD
jgi:hypothetical protein